MVHHSPLSTTIWKPLLIIWVVSTTINAWSSFKKVYDWTARMNYRLTIIMCCQPLLIDIHHGSLSLVIIYQKSGLIMLISQYDKPLLIIVVKRPLCSPFQRCAVPLTKSLTFATRGAKAFDSWQVVSATYPPIKNEEKTCKVDVGSWIWEQCRINQII